MTLRVSLRAGAAGLAALLLALPAVAQRAEDAASPCPRMEGEMKMPPERPGARMTRDDDMDRDGMNPGRMMHMMMMMQMMRMMQGMMAEPGMPMMMPEAEGMAETPPAAPAEEEAGRPWAGMVLSRVDADGDGAVTAEEAASWYEDAFAAMDEDDDEALTRGEYLAALAGPGPGSERRVERRQARFAALDADAGGSVTLAEFIAGGEAAFRGADLDRDGRVSVWEFRAARRW
jgi:hypothetical protein